MQTENRQTHLTKLTVDFRRHSDYRCILLPVALQTVAIPTWHTASSIHNILLQFPHHTALKATKPQTNNTVLDRLTRYILCTFLFQYTSCVMLSISSYKHPNTNSSTQLITNQFNYQWSYRKSEPQLLLTNYDIYYYLTVGDKAHCTEHYQKLHIEWDCLLKCNKLQANQFELEFMKFREVLNFHSGINEITILL